MKKKRNRLGDVTWKRRIRHAGPEQDRRGTERKSIR